MGDGKSKTLHKITRWGSAANSSSSTRNGGGSHANMSQSLTLVEPLDPEDLKQGQLYIVKISLVKLALFEGRWREVRWGEWSFFWVDQPTCTWSYTLVYQRATARASVSASTSASLCVCVIVRLDITCQKNFVENNIFPSRIAKLTPPTKLTTFGLSF